MLAADSSVAKGPQALSLEQTALVRRHLAEVLASHAFSGSKRTQDFLQLIVTHALQREFDSLRERMIGAEMFGRPVSYDTGSDSVVRVKATDVRKKLAQFYAENKEEPPVRIELPSGSYVPRFHFEQPDATAHSQNATSSEAHAEQATAAAGEPSIERPAPPVEGALIAPKRRTSLLVVGALLAAILVAVTGYTIFNRWYANSHALREIRSIAILPLQNLSGDPGQEYFADGMTEELINDLGQVSTLRVISFIRP